MPENSPRVGFRLGVFTLDLRGRSLLRDNQAIVLPARAFDALVFLVTHRDRLVEKDEIVAAVWRDVAVTDDSLIHAVSVLRRALGDDPTRPAFIETVPRHGYRFIGPVEELVEPGQAQESTPNQRAVPLWLRPASIAAAAAAVIATLGLLQYVTHDSSPTSVRLDQPAPPGTSLVSDGVVSPSGRHLAFVARDAQSGRSALWVRALASSEPYPLPGTTAASNPFWSPDGRTLAFFANGKLMAVDVSGGPARLIADVTGSPAGGSWGTRGVILFADSMRGLYAVSDSGGPVRQITRVDHAATDPWYAWPQFLPDSRHFLYQVVAIDGSRAGIFAGSLDSPESVRLLEASAATFAPPGYLLYVQHDMLMAETLDLERMTLSGRPVLLARGLSAPSLAEGNVVSGSRELLAFREGTRRQQLTQVDRSGAAWGGDIDTPVALSNVRLSPDGGSLLATGSVTDAPGVWLVDLVRRQQTRLSADGLGSVWSPDGRRIAFTTRGGRDLFVRSARDGADARIVATDAFVKIVNDWSPDGRQMIYAQIDAETKLDLWSIPASGGTPTPLLKTAFNEAQARISPDGRWIAYVTEQSGAGEVWVRRYPQMDEPRQVSVGGGGQPQWRSDQSELFYLSPGHALMAVDAPGAGRPSFGAPRRLFHTSMVGAPSDVRDSYAVMPDGATFLVYAARETAGPAPITVIRNWAAGLTPFAVVPAPEPRSVAAR